MTDRRRQLIRAAAVVFGLTCALTGAGCSFGPRALEGTHGRYNESVRRVYEQQLLLNIVHQRYDETPTELDVSAIAAQYELSAQVEARPFFLAPNPNSSGIFKTFTAILPDASTACRPSLTAPASGAPPS
jgi:hypothetical protein